MYKWQPLCFLFSCHRRWPAQGPLMFVLSCPVCPCHRSKNASISLYLCQFNSDLYETLNLTLWGPNWLIQLILAIPSVLLVPSGPLWSPSRTLLCLYLCQINSDLYETLILTIWGPNWLIQLILAIPSVLFVPSGPLWSLSRTLLCLYLCQINLDLYETLNLTFWGPNWLIQLILAIPSVLLVPSGP